MSNSNDVTEKTINCTEFEDFLTDYLDGTLERATHKAVAAHALRCPLCHSLLNEVKDALEVCHKISAPAAPLARLEARILELTTPESVMSCAEFENHLTDYLDGFLPAVLFHRWERHAVLCHECTDLPGEVVRSIAALYTFKMDELPVPAGLHARIMEATAGAAQPQAARASVASRFGDWMRSLRLPISVPQFAPVAMMLLFAVLVFSQVAADGSIGGMYRKSFELAEQTYQQSAGILGSKNSEPQKNQEPSRGIFVNEGN